MKRLLKSPATNAVCLSLFTAFYALVFHFSSGCHDEREYASWFWQTWSDFLASGRQAIISWALIAVTVLVVILLVTRRRTYDEYHTAILTNCLVVAAVLILVAIAVFYLMILCDPVGIAEKFTLFVVLHWTTVVFADLAYVLLCRWR